MIKNNIELGKSFKRKGKEDIIIKSILFSTITDIFKTEKNIDISKYLVSIQIKGKNFLVKTNKPIINTEALIYNEQIKKISKERLLKIGIKLLDFDIRYI